MKYFGEIVTGIDIGTSHVRVVLGEVKKEGPIDLISYSEKSIDNGVIKGEIVDVVKVVTTLKSAIDDAEKNSRNIFIDGKNVYLNITGADIYSFENYAELKISPKGKKLKEHDIVNVVEKTRNVSVNESYIPLDFMAPDILIDDKYYLDDFNLNTNVSKISANSCILLANKDICKLFLDVLESVEIYNPKKVFAGLANGICTISEDDLDEGILNIKIGAGITEYVIFKNSKLKKIGVFPVGIEHIINDLYLGLDVNIKFVRDFVTKGEFARVIDSGEPYAYLGNKNNRKKVSINQIDHIVTLRITEIFELIFKEIEKDNLLDSFNNGIILCGGINYIPGSIDIATDVFKTKVRVGEAKNINGLDNITKSQGFITTLGLLKYAQYEFQEQKFISTNSLAKKFISSLSGIWKFEYGNRRKYTNK